MWAPSPTTYPDRGTVGYRGTLADLHVIDSRSTAPPGTSWNSDYNFLQVDADDLTIEGAYVKGGIDFYGGGTLTVRNSIIEGGYGSFFVILARTEGSGVDIRDSTLRWRAGSTPNAQIGNGAIQIQATVRMIALRNDISGTPDGIQLAGGGSRIERNWIHDLAVLGQYPDNTHNDGIQMYDGDDVVIADNRIEIGFNGTHQNAAIFVQPGDGNTVRRLRVVGNYLQGGGYTFRLERPVTTGAVVRGNVFGELTSGAFGFVSVTEGAVIADWSGNLQADGTVIHAP